jgi:lipopolysaccharide export system permease protein
MLFDSSLRRELWRSFVGTLVILLTVVMTMVLIRVLGQATKGSFAPSDVSLILSYAVVGQLPVLLSLALFIAVVTVLSRMWRDSEMVVWQSSGLPQWRFLRPLLRTAWPVVALVALCSLMAKPWAYQQTELLKYRHEKRSDMARVAPGQFQSSADGQRVFFIDSHSEGQERGRNVFMVLGDAQSEAVVTAREGSLTLDGDHRYLVLSQGERSQTNLVTGEKTHARFETARILVGEAPPPPEDVQDPRSMSTMDLMPLSRADAQGELAWRWGFIWATVNLVLAGLLLSTGNTRRHSSWNIVAALLVFVVYFNFMGLHQTWVAKGQVALWSSLLALHGGTTAALMAMIRLKDGPFRRWPWQRGASQGAQP